jgi:hypothetical protein
VSEAYDACRHGRRPSGTPCPHCAETDRLRAALAEAERARDGAYAERNKLVAALARLAPALGWTAGVARTAIDGWDPVWHGCVYIDTPAGQLSWHYHDDERRLFVGLPPYCGAWDGHTTPEKYERLADAAATAPHALDAARAALRAPAAELMDSPVEEELLGLARDYAVACADPDDAAAINAAYDALRAFARRHLGNASNAPAPTAGVERLRRRLHRLGYSHPDPTVREGARALALDLVYGRERPPCGECHLPPGETCDVCGALAPPRAES